MVLALQDLFSNMNFDNISNLEININLKINQEFLEMSNLNTKPAMKEVLVRRILSRYLKRSKVGLTSKFSFALFRMHFIHHFMKEVQPLYRTSQSHTNVLGDRF